MVIGQSGVQIHDRNCHGSFADLSDNETSLADWRTCIEAEISPFEVRLFECGRAFPVFQNFYVKVKSFSLITMDSKSIS